MIHSILAHWKIEAAVVAIVSGIGILIHVTLPDMMFAMQVLATWEEAFAYRMIFSTVIAAVFSMGTWWIQKKVLAKRTTESEKRSADLKKILDHEKEDKERIAATAKDLAETVDQLRIDFTLAQQKLAIMNQTVMPMYEAMKLKMVEILTHPHAEFKVPDELLAKVTEGHLTTEETKELESLLLKRATDPHEDITPQERLAAVALPIIIKLAEIEKESDDPISSVQLVSNTVKSKEEK
jgi:hypothetical protein